MTANLIRLPTAARRMVQQPSGRAAKEYRATFRAAHPWPGEYVWPTQRAAARRLAERQDALAGLNQSPELAIIAAMLRSMPSDKIGAVGLALDQFPGVTESPALIQARAMLDVAARDRRAMEAISKPFEKDRT